MPASARNRAIQAGVSRSAFYSAKPFAKRPRAQFNSAINVSLTKSAKSRRVNGETAMIRSLYDLEDWLFYTSMSCGPARSRRLRAWSSRVGVFADKLQDGFRLRV